MIYRLNPINLKSLKTGDYKHKDICHFLKAIFDLKLKVYTSVTSLLFYLKFTVVVVLRQNDRISVIVQKHVWPT